MIETTRTNIDATHQLTFNIIIFQHGILFKDYYDIKYINNESEQVNLSHKLANVSLEYY